MKRVSLFLVCFISFVAPLGAQFLSIPIGGVKLSLFRLGLGILTILTIFGNKGSFVIYRERNKYSVLFMVSWLVYALITIIWVRDYSNYIRVLFFLFVGMLLIINIENVVFNIAELQLVLLWFEYGILFQSMIGWYEVFTRDYRFLELTETIIYVISTTHPPIAMMGNPNDFATLMFLGLIISCFFVFAKREKIKKILGIIVALNCITLIFLTSSRANEIAIFLFLIVLCITSKRRMIIIFSSVFILFTFYPFIFPFFEKLFSFNFLGLGSDGIRMGLIKSGLSFLVDTYGIGIGTGQIESWMSEGASYYVGNITNMHNWWMEILTSFGIVVFIGYLVFYFNLLFDNYQTMKCSKNHTEMILSRILCAALIGLIIALISSSSNMNFEWLWLFWALCINYQGISFTVLERIPIRFENKIKRFE